MLQGDASDNTTRAAACSTDAPNTAAEALDVRGLTVSYHDKPVLRSVTFQTPPGQLLAVVGPNGAGKSTLLKAVLGLVPAVSGDVYVFGQALDGNRQSVAYVPQTESVDWDFPITAGEVVLMGRYGRLGYFGRPSRRDQAMATQSLETVGMADFVDRHIRQLSGGQQQRIFLARALAQEASIMLLDEPMAGVDARTEEAIFELMRRFSDEGKTLVVVHHNLEALDHFDSVLLLNQSVMAYGPVSETVTKENLQRTYGGQMRFLDEAERQLREAPDHGH
ncbi:MAG: metal ABC transporter ATP-binding protein [Phycisphaerae bacterium]|jgi:manganese/zinc/iron transport system ATP- binding protein